MLKQRVISNIDKIIYPLISAEIVSNFQGKYLFLLDLTPHLAHHLEAFYGFTPPNYGGTLLFTIIPVPQKLFLFLILSLSGVAMNSMASKFVNSKIARFYAGLLYMINPFMYIRVLVGHWTLMLAYAILPVALKYFFELIENYSIKNVVKCALALSGVAVSAHMLFMAAIVIALIVLFNPKAARSLPILGMFFIVLNAYWIVPLLLAKSHTFIHHISIWDIYVFSPETYGYPAVFAVAALYGFWNNHYIYAKDFIPFWWTLLIPIVSLAIYGTLAKMRSKWSVVVPFAAIAVIGVLFASSVEGPIAPIVLYLYKTSAVFRGMRDTQKFVAIICLSYSFLGAFGVEDILNRIERKKLKIIIAALILLTPIAYSFTFFNGFTGQIKTTDFPQDWYKVNNFLNKDKEDFRVLFFPWHLYMDYSWVPNKYKRIANPAPGFFDKEVISAKNIEVGIVYTENKAPYQNFVEFLLKNKNRIKNFGHLVSIIGVKYILLTKEADYRNYFFLFNQTDLKLVMETDHFYVFKNKAFKGVMLSAKGVQTNFTIKNVPKFKPVAFKEISPVKYKIKSCPYRFLIFTAPYSSQWTLGENGSFRAYGVVNGFKYSGQKYLVYKSFYTIYLPAYAVSVISFIICLLLVII